MKKLFKNWKLVNTSKYEIIPFKELRNYFWLSPLEREKADAIYKEKGTIEYIFYPGGGIGWGVKVKVLKTGEEIDITDYSTW